MCVMRNCAGDTVTLYRLSRFRVDECRRCGMRFRQPFPTLEELHEMYDDPRYHASAYFSGQEALDAASPEMRIHESALDWLDRHKGSGNATPPALLDVGCGTGMFLRLARRRGWQVSGVELSRSLSQRADEQYGLHVLCADFLEAPLAENAYRAITMWDFLEHVIDPEAVLQRARTLLAPGGCLVIFTIDTSSLFNVLGDLTARVGGRRANTLLELLYDARHNYYFTRNSLASLLARAGFRTVDTESHRAYLGRWLSEPAPAPVRLAGDIVDLASVAIGKQYRQLVYCAPASVESSNER